MSGIDKTILRINDAIMAIDPLQDFERNPKLHVGINAQLMTMRAELHYLESLNIEIRKERMRELLVQDFLQEDKELRQVGLAYINDIP